MTRPSEYDAAADVRAAFERLLAEVTAERDTLRRSLAATRAELESVRAQLDECDGTAAENRKWDEAMGRDGYEVVP